MDHRISVFRYFKRRLAEIDPRLSAEFEEAEDESVDDGATVFLDGAETEISVQLGWGYYCVSRLELEPEVVSTHLYMGNDVLEAAQVAALAALDLPAATN